MDKEEHPQVMPASSNPYLPYNPGRLPTAPSPVAGETIELELDGYPPWKDTHFSIRNVMHRHHDRFVALRAAATEAMRGRAWYRGDVGLHLELRAPEMEAGRSLLDYVGGVMDTLDGSHGPSFTYLPVVYEDDYQAQISYRFVEAASKHYRLRLEFRPSANG